MTMQGRPKMSIVFSVVAHREHTGENEFENQQKRGCVVVEAFSRTLSNLWWPWPLVITKKGNDKWASMWAFDETDLHSSQIARMGLSRDAW